MNDSHPALPCRTSVVIVSYNNFSTTTGPCLESLAAGAAANLEIVVVDNNSQDGSAEQLQDYVRRHPDIVVQLNRENRGFAGGNNDGVRLASGEVIVLLNSDTIVPSGAMAKFSQALADHQDWAMVGPMTNEAGNEQRIFTTGQSVQEIMMEGEEWCRHAGSRGIPTDSLVFFCVAIRRDLYLRLGGLDEDYGLGFYEDTDFCVRALAQGCRLLIAEDIFVYHQGSATFSGDPQKTKRLLRKNEKIFQQKNPGVPKIQHVREKLLAVMAHYLAGPGGKTAGADTAYLFENRMHLARQLGPRNFFKRLAYQAGLRKLERKFADRVE